MQTVLTRSSLGRILAIVKRRVLIGLASAAVLAAVMAGAVAAVLLRHPRASREWAEFRIAPASGDSTWIGRSEVRSDGMTLKHAIAVAYDLPSVRVVGPDWLGRARYSVTAVVSQDAPATLGPLLRKELETRLNLATHVEPRPYDVLVITGGDPALLRKATERGPNTRIERQQATIRGGSMAVLAAGLQTILGRPVINDTRVGGDFDFDFQWSDDRQGGLTTQLRERYGITLAPEQRLLDTLVVDRAERDAALLLLAQAGRATYRAPSGIRKDVADILFVR